MRTGDAQAKEDAKDTESFLNFLQDFLLAFGGIALFVGSFVIANSLSITIAQRTRELATLRTLGASRRQVLGSIVVEALAMGIFSSVVGIFLGLGLGTGLFRLFDAVGFTLPNNGLVLHARTVVVALIVGIVVTLLASLRPALRATRVPPISAVREGATLPHGRASRGSARPVDPAHRRRIRCALYGLFGNGPRHDEGARLHGARHAADLLRDRLAVGTVRPPARVVARLAGGPLRRSGRRSSPATTRAVTRSAPPRPRRR